MFYMPVQTSIYTGTCVIDTTIYTCYHTHHGVYICTRVCAFFFTVAHPGVQVLTALAVLDIDEDELLDPAKAEVLLGSDGVGMAVLVILEVVDDANTSVAALVAEDGVLLLEAAAEADVEVLVLPAVLRNAVSATVEGPEVEVLASPAELEDVAFALGENEIRLLRGS